jgi:hypothetical protein
LAPVAFAADLAVRDRAVPFAGARPEAFAAPALLADSVPASSGSVPVSSTGFGLAAAFLDRLARFAAGAEAEAAARALAAGTARFAGSARTSTVTPASSRARRTAFMRFIGTSAASQAERTASASTLPRVLPWRRSSCMTGWLNSDGRGREVETDDTDNLSSC